MRELQREGGVVLVVRRAVHKAGVLLEWPVARLRFLGQTFDSPYGRLAYVVHPYNATWRAERCVELPYARAFLARRSGRGLEVGNVLSHYGPVSHRIVDKYERAPGVENIDVLDIEAQALDYVVCLSTLEHVGWDEPERDPDKALVALAKLREVLAPTGRLLVSFRLGHHPRLTDAVQKGLPVERETIYVPVSGRWRRADEAEDGRLWIGELPA
jgi:hypothetical protein